MKFQRDKRFDAQFDLVPALRWYPYVGKNFGKDGKRIMVYAHNIPISAATYDEKKREWSDKAAWADSMDEYTYCQGKWTNAFRYFIKGAVGLKSNYGENSESAIIPKSGVNFVIFHQNGPKSGMRDPIVCSSQSVSPSCPCLGERSLLMHRV